MNSYPYLGNDLFLKIFHTPEAEAVNLPSHSKLQITKISFFIFFYSFGIFDNNYNFNLTYVR